MDVFERRKRNSQVEETSFADICRDEFGGELNGIEEHRQVACGSNSETMLLGQNMSISRTSVDLIPSHLTKPAAAEQVRHT
jgi:hypothetical protein